MRGSCAETPQPQRGQGNIHADETNLRNEQVDGLSSNMPVE
jgi:hypothetical protein